MSTTSPARCTYCQANLTPNQAAYCTPWCNKQARNEIKRLTTLQKHLAAIPLTDHTLNLYRRTTSTLRTYQQANLAYLQPGRELTDLERARSEKRDAKYADALAA